MASFGVDPARRGHRGSAAGAGRRCPGREASRPSPSNGYHSAIYPAPEATAWVQVDLGRSVPIEEIRLVPARPVDFPDTPGFGFPHRFRVEVSDDPGFAAGRTTAIVEEDRPDSGAGRG